MLLRAIVALPLSAGRIRRFDLLLKMLRLRFPDGILFEGGSLAVVRIIARFRFISITVLSKRYKCGF